MWKSLGAAGLAVMLLMGLSACGGAADKVPDAAQTETKEAVSRKLADSTGTEVALPRHPKRVVILNPSNVDLYMAAGGKDTLVGRPTTKSFSKETMEAVKDVKTVGMIHQPSAETIVALHPDLVIGVNVPYHVQLRDVLAASGIPLFINALDSYEDVLKTLTLYGELTGETKTAEESLSKVKAAYEEAVAQSRGQSGPTALILFRTPQGSQMGTAKSFSGDLLQRLGGQNIADGQGTAKEAYTALSQEYVAERDPQKIFIISMGNTPDQLKDFEESLKTDKAWNGLTAVQTGEVYVLPGELFTINPGMRIGDAMRFMVKCLYGK